MILDNPKGWNAKWELGWFDNALSSKSNGKGHMAYFVKQKTNEMSKMRLNQQFTSGRLDLSSASPALLMVQRQSKRKLPP